MHGCKRWHSHIRPPTFPPPAAFLFGNAPRQRLEQVLREHNPQPEQWVEWISPYICLVVNAAEKALVLGFHFPFPGLGHIVQKGEGWQWQPIETMD